MRKWHNIRWMERDLSEISCFEAPHTGGQRWGRVGSAVKELTALMKETTSVSKHLKKCTEACNYETTWLYKTKSADILTKTHNIYIIMQTPQLYHSSHITKSNFMLSFSICLLETDLISASAQSAHVSFFLTQSSSFPAISPYCEAPHASNLPFKWVSLLSCVLQKNMKLLPPSDPCILTTVM